MTAQPLILGGLEYVSFSAKFLAEGARLNLLAWPNDNS